MREAPSLSIIQSLQDFGAIVRAYDPEGGDEASELLGDVTFASDAYDAVTGADAAVIVTEWDIFRALDLKRMKSLMTTPVLVDLRNIYRHEEVTNFGFAYHSVGRPHQR
jgi:UDPglucose 6-dehydrogenase